MGTKQKFLNYEAQLKELNIMINRLMNGPLVVQPKLPCYDFESVIKEMDHLQATSRYIWDFLPPNLTSQLIENLLYIKGSLAMFVDEGTLQFLPYANNGKLNYYSYPTEVHPVPLSGGEISNKKLIVAQKGNINPQANCVLLFDRAPIYANRVVGMAVVNDPLIRCQANIIERAQINLYNSTKKVMVSVDNDAQANQMAKDVEASIADTSPFVITRRGASLEFEPTATGIDNETTDIMTYYQSVNNLRQLMLGIGTGVTFEKNERMLTNEISEQTKPAYLILYSGLQARQEALDTLKLLYPNSEAIQRIQVRLNPMLEFKRDSDESNSQNKESEGDENE